MAALRSRSRRATKTPVKTLEEMPPPPSSPPHPSTPSVSDTAPNPSPSTPLGSGLGLRPDAHAPPLPRRRSLRLAAISGSAAPSPPDANKTRRKRASGVLSSGTTQEEVEKKVEGGYMSLRSGSRIARRRLEVARDDSSQAEKEKEKFEGDSDHGGGGGTEENEQMEGVGTRRFTDEEKGKAELVAEEGVMVIGMKKEVKLDKDTIVLEETRAFKRVEDVSMNHRKIMREMNGKAKRKFSEEDKGKGKLVVEDNILPIDRQGGIMIDVGSVSLDEVGEHLRNGDGSVQHGKTGSTKAPKVSAVQSESRKAADRSKAIELAPKFAFFKPEAEDDEKGEEDNEDSLEEVELESEDWPGPFSTAMKIIEERAERLMARESKMAYKEEEFSEVMIQWTPSVDRKHRALARSAPSLKYLCLKVLCENAEEIESLQEVPDAMRNRLISVLCSCRRMSSRLLGLLCSGSPSEIRVDDCSWATEKQFEEALAGCNTDNLKVIQLDLSGRCLPDYVLRATLARSPNCLPSVTTISLNGAYRLSDDGLNAIASSAPFLSSVSLCQCSLITSSGIINLADKLGSVLKELYLDNCQDVDAMLILPALTKLTYLEVLSMSGIETVCDKFVRKLIPVCGAKLRELGFACCRKLSGASLKIIGENCSQLRAIDLRNLPRLNDSAIGHLANGCRTIQTLKLQSNLFSDEAIAAFLEASGGSLVELSLNSVEKAAQHTAVAISRRCCSTLQSLDLSFCRKMTNEALGLIVDKCSYLRILKLFGCTQVTNVFLDGHSNSLVKIIGLKGPVLELVKMPDFL